MGVDRVRKCGIFATLLPFQAKNELRKITPF